MHEELVNVQHVTKSFGPVKAVDDISFTINKGEIVGLLGPNGAGKSTTMRLLTGYLAPDSGSISVGNYSVLSQTLSAQRIIGYLPESNPLYKEMLVSEMIKLAAELSGMHTDEVNKNLERIIPAVGLNDFYNRKISELSKGYKQRVGIAMALIHDPKILIMDEPSEGLDPTQRAEIRQLIKDLAEDRTIILSTHVMQEVTAVCNRVIIINHGSIVADGQPHEIMQAAQSQQIMDLQLQGQSVQPLLDKLDSLQSVEILEEGDDRFTLRVTLADKEGFVHDLARLTKQHDWIIWQMHDQEFNLEEVFTLITKE